MCITFIYNGSNDTGSDYSLILAANRDEFYERPSQAAAKWTEDEFVIGGRGKIVENFVKSNDSVEEYVEDLKSYGKLTNDFNFIAVELSKTTPKIYSYSNATEDLQTWCDFCLGFSNSLPGTPLQKVLAGKIRLAEVCKKHAKLSEKETLVGKLVELLKWDHRHLPDPELQRRNPGVFEKLSSVYVVIPDGSYGTRTHSIVLLTKSGSLDFIEWTMKAPIDTSKPVWVKNEFHYQI